MHLHGDRRIYTGNLDELVCLCLKVQRNKILETIEEIDATTVAQVRRKCRAGGGCGSCHEEIARLITQRRLNLMLDFDNHITGEAQDHSHDLHFSLSEDNAGKLIETQVITQIKNFITSQINPYLAKFDVTACIIESGEELVLDLTGADQELKYTLGFWLDHKFHERFPTITVIIA
jgi:bacterioferritin-associated ferredoxin